MLQQQIDEEDEKILESFLSKNVGPQKTLADVIIKRIKEKDAEVQSGIIKTLIDFDSLFSCRFIYFCFFFYYVNTSLILLLLNGRYSTSSEI